VVGCNKSKHLYEHLGIREKKKNARPWRNKPYRYTAYRKQEIIETTARSGVAQDAKRPGRITIYGPLKSLFI
jgi:hypothetical protein